MKQTLIIILLTVSGLTAFSQKSGLKHDDFIQFPKEYLYRDSLIKYIMPGEEYTYWEFDYGWGARKKIPPKVIYSRGVKSGGVSFVDPGGSLFTGCAPVFCYRYIAYVKDGKVGYIMSDLDLLKFMGGIDNLEEALLMAEIAGNVYPDQLKIGGEYLVYKNGYELILTKSTLCPQTKEAIQVSISNDTIRRKVSKGVYLKTNNCIII